MRKKYDWDEWFSQSRTVLEYGVHYHCAQSTMCQLIRNAASARKVGVHLTDSGSEIVVEVVERTPRAVPRADQTAVPS